MMKLHSLIFILTDLFYLILAYGIRTLKYDEVLVELICILSAGSICRHPIVL